MRVQNFLAIGNDEIYSQICNAKIGAKEKESELLFSKEISSTKILPNKQCTTKISFCGPSVCSS